MFSTIVNNFTTARLVIGETLTPAFVEVSEIGEIDSPQRLKERAILYIPERFPGINRFKEKGRAEIRLGATSGRSGVSRSPRKPAPAQSDAAPKSARFPSFLERFSELREQGRDAGAKELVGEALFKARSPDEKARLAEDLFFLTTPAWVKFLEPKTYWEILWSYHFNTIPVVRGLFFQQREGQEAGWDLYRRHVQQAFFLAEAKHKNRYATGFYLREAALNALWADIQNPDRAPEDIWRSIIQRTLELAKEVPHLGWPVLAANAKALIDSGYVDLEALSMRLKDEMERIAKNKFVPGFQNALVSAALAFEVASLDLGKPFPSLLPDSQITVMGPLWLDVFERCPDLIDRYRPRFLELLRGFKRHGIQLDAKIPRKILEAVLTRNVLAPGSWMRIYNQAIDHLRCHLYDLNPAATVEAWHDLTGFRWNTSQYPSNNHPDGILASKRWLAQKMGESDEVKLETAKRYWDLEARLLGREPSEEPSQDELLKWWEKRLGELLAG